MVIRCQVAIKPFVEDHWKAKGSAIINEVPPCSEDDSLSSRDQHDDIQDGFTSILWCLSGCNAKGYNQTNPFVARSL